MVLCVLLELSAAVVWSSLSGHLQVSPVPLGDQSRFEEASPMGLAPLGALTHILGSHGDGIVAPLRCPP